MSFNTYKNIKNEIEKYNNFILTTCVGNSPASTETVYFNDGFDLYCYLHNESQTVKQIEYNSKVETVIYSGGASNKQGLLVEGQAQIITNFDDEEKIRKQFAKSFKSMRAFINSEDSTLIKITPVQIERINNRKINSDEVLKFKENKPSQLKNIFSAFGRWLKKWFNATRLGFSSTTIGALILGAGLAYFYAGEYAFSNGLNVALACVGALFAHISTNLLNDYYDEKNGTDRLNPNPTPFSGGSRMIQNGIIEPEKILVVAWLFLLATIGIGLYLNAQLPGNWLLLIGGIGVSFAYFYSAPPIKLVERGLGELAISLGFSIVMIMGLFYVMTGQFDWTPVIASVPLGIMMFLIIFINEFQDEQFDRQAGKNHLVARFQDKRKAVWLYNYLMFFPYLWVIGFVLGGYLPYYTLIILVLLPLSWKAVRNAAGNYDRNYELLQTNGLTIAIHILFSILFTIGFLLESLLQ